MTNQLRPGLKKKSVISNTFLVKLPICLNFFFIVRNLKMKNNLQNIESESLLPFLQNMVILMSNVYPKIHKY